MFVGRGWVALMVPKTGSGWLRQTCTAGALARRCGFVHSWDKAYPGPDVMAAGIGAPQAIDRENNLVMSIVRHPLAWYQSFWAWRTRDDWGKQEYMQWPVEPHAPGEVYAPSFQAFVEHMMEHHPGYLGQLYDQFFWRADFLARTENLNEDFAWFLSEMASVEIRGPARAMMRSDKRVNVTDLNIKERAVMPARLEAALVDSEQDALRYWENALVQER